MLPFFTSPENTSCATWLRESNTIWAYPTVLTPWPARTLAAVSLVVWVAAITAGRFMAYV